jgi:hypothetical protein
MPANRIAIGVKLAAALVIAAVLNSPFAVNAAPVSVPLDRLRACLAIEDMTRLDCLDAIVPPEPKSVTAKPSAVVECRFYREEDDRLRCFNSFLVERAPSAPRLAPTSVPRPAPASTPQIPRDRFRLCRGIPKPVAG